MSRNSGRKYIQLRWLVSHLWHNARSMPYDVYTVLICIVYFAQSLDQFDQYDAFCGSQGHKPKQWGNSQRLKPTAVQNAIFLFLQRFGVIAFCEAAGQPPPPWNMMEWTMHAAVMQKLLLLFRIIIIHLASDLRRKRQQSWSIAVSPNSALFGITLSLLSSLQRSHIAWFISALAFPISLLTKNAPFFAENGRASLRLLVRHVKSIPDKQLSKRSFSDQPDNVGFSLSSIRRNIQSHDMQYAFCQ